jgi:predicted nuclease of predicted toxin-antitoxin system
MIFWFDAQLSPQLAPWFAQRFGVTAYAVRDLGLRDATDRAILGFLARTLSAPFNGSRCCSLRAAYE